MKHNSLLEAGFHYGGFIRQYNAHRLIDMATGRPELWFANKNHASYGIKWRRTTLEFLSSSQRAYPLL